MILSFSSAVKRIKDINWSIEEEPKESHSVLLSEYLRRMAVFVKTYSSNHSPIGSPLKILNIDYNNLLLKIDRTFDEKLPNINNPIVAHIYEPIINFFERGGILRFDSDRALSCGSAAFVLEKWVDIYNSRIEKDISDLNLESIDLNGN